MIRIEFIPHEKQRYDTLGDWIPCGDDLLILVSDTGDPRMNLLIALHEMIEAELCTQRSIAEVDVAAWDMQRADLDDPGSHPHAPYHREHMFAETVERLVCAEMGIDWADYERVCDETTLRRVG